MSNEQTSAGAPVERQLRDLARVIAVLKQRLLPYFDGDVKLEEGGHGMKAELESFRRVLLFQINAILDVHGPNPGGGGMTRAGLAMDMMTEDLKEFGIVRTQDGELFTFAKPDDETTTPA